MSLRKMTSLCQRTLSVRYFFTVEKEPPSLKDEKSASSLKTTAATVTSRPQPHPVRWISMIPASRTCRRNWEVTLDATIFGGISCKISCTIPSP